MTLNQQFQTVLSMLFSGFIIGFFFDGYRVLKGRMNIKPWIIFIVDVLFGVFSAFFIFGLLLWSNRGQLRFIIIAAFIIGLWIYYKTASKSVIRLWLIIYSMIHSLWKFLIRTIQVLIIKPVLFLYKTIIIVIGFLISTIYGTIHFLQKLLAPPSVKLYNRTKSSSRKLKDKIQKKAGIRSLLKKWFKWKK